MKRLLLLISVGCFGVVGCSSTSKAKKNATQYYDKSTVTNVYSTHTDYSTHNTFNDYSTHNTLQGPASPTPSKPRVFSEDQEFLQYKLKENSGDLGYNNVTTPSTQTPTVASIHVAPNNVSYNKPQHLVIVPEFHRVVAMDRPPEYFPNKRIYLEVAKGKAELEDKKAKAELSLARNRQF